MVVRAASASDLSASVAGQIEAAVASVGKPAGKAGLLKGSAANEARRASKAGVKEAIERRTPEEKRIRAARESEEQVSPRTAPERPSKGDSVDEPAAPRRKAKAAPEPEPEVGKSGRGRKSPAQLRLEREQDAAGDEFARIAEETIKSREAREREREEPEPEPDDEQDADEAEDSEDDPDEETAADADDLGEEAEDDEEDEALSHQDALTELRAAGFGKDARRRLSKQDAVQMATALRAASAKRTSETARAVDPAAPPTGAAPAQGQPGAQPAASPAAAVSSFDPKKATERLRRQYGDEDADGFGEGLKAANDDARQYADHRFTAVSGHLAQREKDLVEQTLKPLAAAVGKIQLALTRQELVRAYPELENDKQWARLVKAASQHRGRESYTDLGELLSDVAAIRLAGRARKREEREGAHRARDRSTISTSSRSVTGPKIRSKDDAFAAVANAVIAGDDEEADRVAREHFR